MSDEKVFVGQWEESGLFVVHHQGWCCGESFGEMVHHDCLTLRVLDCCLIFCCENFLN